MKSIHPIIVISTRRLIFRRLWLWTGIRPPLRLLCSTKSLQIHVRVIKDCHQGNRRIWPRNKLQNTYVCTHIKRLPLLTMMSYILNLWYHSMKRTFYISSLVLCLCPQRSLIRTHWTAGVISLSPNSSPWRRHVAFPPKSVSVLFGSEWIPEWSPKQNLSRQVAASLKSDNSLLYFFPCIIINMLASDKFQKSTQEDSCFRPNFVCL
jgi:hypothetical protein